jgi:signal transduction histidine kinase
LHTFDKSVVDKLVHQYWEQLAATGVQYAVEGEDELNTPIPASAFKIVLGNLLKNAFAHTLTGKVSVVLKQNGVEVIDSGVGLAAPPQENDSFGLGLVLVKDICRQFSCDFELKGNNDGQGCVATITWS